MTCFRLRLGGLLKKISNPIKWVTVLKTNFIPIRYFSFCGRRSQMGGFYGILYEHKTGAYYFGNYFGSTDVLEQLTIEEINLIPYELTQKLFQAGEDAERLFHERADFNHKANG